MSVLVAKGKLSSKNWHLLPCSLTVNKSVFSRTFGQGFRELRVPELSSPCQVQLSMFAFSSP